MITIYLVTIYHGYSINLRYGRISCNLLNVAIPLDATAKGDGGFVIVPGSHKANFPIPGDLEKCDNLSENEYLLNPRLDPGRYFIVCGWF